MFPSPLGVSYFQMRKINMKKLNDVLFPSPLGVSYFQIEKERMMYVVAVGFRPLSGYLISK